MLLGNIKGKKLRNYYLLSSIITAINSLVLFFVLGFFYKAVNNTILVNIFVWTLAILLSFFLFYFPYYGINRFKKLPNYGPLLNGYAIASGMLSILGYCLANSYLLEDYSYTTILSFMAGIIVFIQVASDIAKKTKDKNKNVS